MEGAQVLRGVAVELLARDEPLSIENTTALLSDMAAVGALKADHQAVAQQLADLTRLLLQMRKHEGSYVARHIRDRMTLLAKAFMQLPDSPLQNNAGQSLAPYFSTASERALPARMTILGGCSRGGIADHAGHCRAGKSEGTVAGAARASGATSQGDRRHISRSRVRAIEH
jgi:hypothetical protein